MISIPGFHEPARCDRKIAGRFGGGCLIYVSKRPIFEQKHDLQVDCFDHVWVDIKIDNTMYTVTTWYRPPNSENHDDFMTTSENILTKLQTYQADNKIIMADFNFGNCYSKCPVLPHKPLDSMAPELFESFGFTQVIDIPTRVTKDTVALVDLIFIQNLDYMTLHGTLPKIADHDGIVVTFHSNRPKVLPRTRTVHDYNKLNEEELIKYIKNLNFHDLILSHPIKDQPQLMTSLLTQAFNKFVPSKEILIRPNAPAWTNTYTRLLQRRKNRNYILYKKANSKYLNAVAGKTCSVENLTKLHDKKCNAYEKSHESRNISTNANRRAHKSFYNSVNSTMNNPYISAKKEIWYSDKPNENTKNLKYPPINRY